MNLKKWGLGASICLSVFAFSSCESGGINTNVEDLESVDSFSYAYGSLVGASMVMSGLEPDQINIEDFAVGLAHALDSAALLETDSAQMVVANIMEPLVQKQQEEMMRQQQAMMAAQSAEKKPQEDAWFAENVDNIEGIQKTASGLRYEILKEGTGEKPTKTNMVRVHYHGTFIDGSVFDSSVERGQPAEFGVTQVIPGWIEALQLMPVGSKWKLYIPYDLAYGPQGNRGIPGFSTLIFEVELIEIVG